MHLRLFSMMVEAVLRGVGGASGGQGSSQPRPKARRAARRRSCRWARGLLGVRQAAPNAVVLAETGKAPLWRR